MLKQIAGTTATKILITGLGFITVILATRYLGAEEYGNISLFILTIAILHLITGIAGGPALVYLVPRIPLGQLFMVSFIWSAFIHISGWIYFTNTGTFSSDIYLNILALSFIHYLNTFAYTVLLGKKKIKLFNIILLLQAFFLLVSFIIQLLLFSDRSFRIFFYSLYISYGIAAITGWAFIYKDFLRSNFSGFIQEFGKIMKYGGFLQTANALQLFNYRLSFFFIDHFLGRSFLGIYNAGIQLSEGIWIFGKSFAVVQYSNISNSNDPEYAVRLTLLMMKTVFVIAFFCLVVLTILPEQFYMLLFGPEFGNVKKVVLFLSPGILALSASQILSHYFSGTGRQHHNAIGSAAGLAVTLLAGITLIPLMGLAGAGLTASLAYLTITLYQIIVFVRTGNCKVEDFLIKKEELNQGKALLKSIFNNQERE
jgi:O-antigen/teichoic acid export membrane protein